MPISLSRPTLHLAYSVFYKARFQAAVSIPYQERRKNFTHYKHCCYNGRELSCAATA